MVSMRTSFLLLASLCLLLPSSSSGHEVVCEDLPLDLCSFAISSTAKRCVLESSPKGNGEVEYQCRTSGVVVDRLSNWVETDGCVAACGVDRHTVGISSDSLMESQFASKLCSPRCYQNCPNIVDLYFNLAAGEGVFLPDLCVATRSNPHRAMVELMSSGAAMLPSDIGSASAPSPSS